MEEKKYILSELDELSPLLKEMKAKEKNIGPDKAYFDDLQARVMSHIVLDKAATSSQFNEVPKDYFEKLPNIVLDKVNGQEAKQVKLVSYRKWIGIAASLIILIIALPFVFKNIGQVDTQMADNTKVNISESISKDLTEEDIDYLIHRYGSEEDMEMIKSADIDKAELSIEAINAEDIDVNLTDEDLEYLNSIM